MDLNYLCFRHQISLMRAAAAACVPSRQAHAGLALLYADRIAVKRERCGANAPFLNA